MKLYRRILLFVILMTHCCQSLSQNYGDVEYYLIDSLDLELVSPTDIELLNTHLDNFHNSKNDTTKFKEIDFIVENSWDENIWPRYNDWLLEKSNVKLREDDLSEQLRRFYLRFKSGALNNIGFYLDVKERLTYQ